MDHAEWQAAYRRATMDDGTMRDMIEDLQIERGQLLERIRELEAENAYLSECEQRYASDYFRWRRAAERLNRLLRALEAERDQWQRQAMTNG